MEPLIDLSAFDDEFEAAAPPERAAFEDLPDGRYQVRVDEVRLEATKNGHPVLKLKTLVVTGPHQGRCHWVNRVITSGSITYLKGDLAILGYGGKLSGLEDPQVRASFLDLVLEIQIKTKGEDDQGRPNRNTYLNRRLNLPPQQDGAQSAARAAARDEPPF